VLRSRQAGRAIGRLPGHGGRRARCRRRHAPRPRAPSRSYRSRNGRPGTDVYLIGSTQRANSRADGRSGQAALAAAGATTAAQTTNMRTTRRRRSVPQNASPLPQSPLPGAEANPPRRVTGARGRRDPSNEGSGGPAARMSDIRRNGDPGALSTGLAAGHRLATRPRSRERLARRGLTGPHSAPARAARPTRLAHDRRSLPRRRRRARANAVGARRRPAARTRARRRLRPGGAGRVRGRHRDGAPDPACPPAHALPAPGRSRSARGRCRTRLEPPPARPAARGGGTRPARPGQLLVRPSDLRPFSSWPASPAPT
jgi:hypothetical protein